MQSLFWPIEHLDKNRQLTLRLCKFLCINLWADCKRSRNLHCNPLFRKVFVRIYSLGILSEEFNHIKTCLQFDWTITNYAAMTRHFRYVCRLSCNFTITNGWLKAHSANYHEPFRSTSGDGIVWSRLHVVEYNILCAAERFILVEN